MPRDAMAMAGGTDTSMIVHCTVLDIQAVHKGRLMALASVEVDVDGVVFVIDGVRVFKYRMPGHVQDFAGVSAPQFRDANGAWRSAVQLPPEIEGAFTAAVMRRCNELGITDVKRSVGTFGDGAPASTWRPE